MYEEEAVFPPHVGLKHHNVYYRTLNRNTTSRGRDGTAFNLIGSLSSDVFERRTSTGSEPFSLLISLDVTVFVLPIGLILVETICPKMCSKSRLKCAKSPFPVDVRRSKTSLFKLPNETAARQGNSRSGKLVS